MVISKHIEMLCAYVNTYDNEIYAYVMIKHNEISTLKCYTKNSPAKL